MAARASCRLFVPRRILTVKLPTLPFRCVLEELYLINSVSNREPLPTDALLRIITSAAALSMDKSLNALSMDVESWLRVDSDGMINATALARRLGTTTQGYERNKDNQRFWHALQGQLGCEVMTGGEVGSTEPRKYHARLAIDMARWYIPEMTVHLNGVFAAYVTGNLTTEHSMAAARSLSAAIDSTTGSSYSLALAERCQQQEKKIDALQERIALLTSIFGDIDLEEEPVPAATSLSIEEEEDADADFDPSLYIKSPSEIVSMKRRRAP